MNQIRDEDCVRYGGKFLKDMSREELIRALLNIGHKYTKLLHQHEHNLKALKAMASGKPLRWWEKIFLKG